MRVAPKRKERNAFGSTPLVSIISFIQPIGTIGASPPHLIDLLINPNFDVVDLTLLRQLVN